MRFIENLLSTYVGREPSQLILEGQIRRGDMRTITAAIMLIDLRDFTMLTNILAPRAVIRLLNEYFDCVFPAVREHGGEILEIMGDGVLAIFRQEAARRRGEACRAALEAAQRRRFARSPSATGECRTAARCCRPAWRCITARCPTAISGPATGSISR